MFQNGSLLRSVASGGSKCMKYFGKEKIKHERHVSVVCDETMREED
jgi:hypothetical protein